MPTTKTFQQVAEKLKVTKDQLYKKPVFNAKTGELKGKTIHAQMAAGKVPPSLEGMILLHTEMDAKTKQVIGWHWMTPQQFSQRYTTTKYASGQLHKDVYIPRWKAKGLL